tara:strand:+ start:989 stop:1804 length:816 start_codon:yes stop_codon:yes gene_type:complete
VNNPLIQQLRKNLRPYAKAKLWNKCFGIGQHKTGTTSLNKIFQLLGYDCAPQQEIEIATTKQVMHGNYVELFRQVEKYDFFQDSPFAQGLCWVALDAKFPGSKFIYTDRDPDSWFASLFNFHNKRTKNIDLNQNSENIIPDSYLREGYQRENIEHYYLSTSQPHPNHGIDLKHDLLYNEEHYKKIYCQRREQIIKYFQKRPSDLLIIDLTKETDISRISDFLDLPSWINFTIPHVNKTDKSEATRNQGIDLLSDRLKRRMQRGKTQKSPLS